MKKNHIVVLAVLFIAAVIFVSMKMSMQEEKASLVAPLASPVVASSNVQSTTPNTDLVDPSVPELVVVVPAKKISLDLGIERLKSIRLELSKRGFIINDTVPSVPGEVVPIEILTYSKNSSSKERIELSEILEDLMNAGYRPINAVELVSMDDNFREISEQCIFAFGTILKPESLSRRAIIFGGTNHEKTFRAQLYDIPLTGWNRNDELLLAVVKVRPTKSDLTEKK
ncbi:MAG: hypothetical protein K9M11_00765 [Candidatus Pacebacteria bacterium]|nr:hypothetical protein [Candidatus Paceibacterota bacterium]